MAELDFDVHFGSAIDKKVNWRDALTVDEPDDDEELAITPEDVIGMLGFDPKEFSERTLEKEIGLGTILKIGTANSGNRGHEGRPGQIGGSGSGGSSETNSLFAKTDQEIRDIEARQESLNKDVFVRRLDEKDFYPGGKYEALAKEYIASDDLQAAVDSGDLSVSVQNSNSTAKEGNASQLVKMVNKFDSQNALYDKLKDDKDFIALSDHMEGLRREGFDPSKAPSIEDQKRAAVRDLVDQWSSTSGDTNPRAIAMQMAAKDLFGGDPTLSHLENVIRIAAKIDPYIESELKFNPGRKAFLQAQYDATQEYLKKNNIKEMILYRGQEGKRTKLDSGHDVAVNLQPLSSFSLSSRIAVDFTNADNYIPEFKPSVIASIVPAKRIFALPNTGIGCTGEKEVVVLGGKTKATVVAGLNNIEVAFGIIPKSRPTSANGVKVNIVQEEMNSGWWDNLSAPKKALKQDTMPNLDEDLENADWTKRGWDLPKFGSVKFDEFLAASGMTLDHFKTLPVYKWMIESGLKSKKEIGLSGIFQKTSR